MQGEYLTFLPSSPGPDWKVLTVCPFSGKGQTVSTLGFAGREVSTVGAATSHGRWAWLRSNNISFTGTKMWIPYKLHKSQTSNLLSFPFPTKSKNHS